MLKRTLILSLAIGSFVASGMPALAQNGRVWEAPSNGQWQNGSSQTNMAARLSNTTKSVKPKGIIPGYVAKDNIEKVNNEIHWYTSLNQAEDQARRENKMVLWVHMIGQMDGAT